MSDSARKSLSVTADFREINTKDLRKFALLVEALSDMYGSDRQRILRAALRFVGMDDPWEHR